jgi:hypothetical protein
LFVHEVFFDLQQTLFRQLCEQQSELAPQPNNISLQQTLFRQRSPEAQSIDWSQVPPSVIGPLAQVPFTHTPEQQSPFSRQLVLLALQHVPFWQTPEQQWLLLEHVNGTSLQHLALRQSSPETQSTDSSQVPPRATGPDLHCPLTHTSEQHCELDVQVVFVGLQQLPLVQIASPQQFELVVQEVFTPLQQVPDTQLPEQQSEPALHVSGTSLQQWLDLHSRPDTQSTDSSHVPPSAIGPDLQTLFTQTSEQQSAFDAQLPPVEVQVIEFVVPELPPFPGVEMTSSSPLSSPIWMYATNEPESSPGVSSLTVRKSVPETSDWNPTPNPISNASESPILPTSAAQARSGAGAPFGARQPRRPIGDVPLSSAETRTIPLARIRMDWPIDTSTAVLIQPAVAGTETVLQPAGGSTQELSTQTQSPSQVAPHVPQFSGSQPGLIQPS